MNRTFKLDLPQRPRRLRRTPAIRELLAETTLVSSDFVAPLFVIDGNSSPEKIPSMPGVLRFNLRDLVKECRQLLQLGVRAVALFPKLNPKQKDPFGSAALDKNSLVVRAIQILKKQLPDLIVITDLALDPYTTHGHDGILTADGSDVDNDATVQILQQQSLLYAQAGADFVAPSDMMDGRVRAIRSTLDNGNFTNTGIIAYSAKYASAYYGPFRDAVGSSSTNANSTGTSSKSPRDKKTYQLNPANRREALIEAATDLAESADILMVKPAGLYLDIIREIRDRHTCPLAAYQVSGEYSQIMAAAKLGWLDLEKTRHESLLAIKRAGADLIFTYFAKDEARALKKR